MSEVDKLIEEEAVAAEEGRDAPPQPGSRVTRPNRARSTVYSVRLNAEEVAAVQRLGG